MAKVPRPCCCDQDKVSAPVTLREGDPCPKCGSKLKFAETFEDTHYEHYESTHALICTTCEFAWEYVDLMEEKEDG